MTEIATLESRVNRLEQRSRRQRVLCIFLAVGLASTLLLGARRSDDPDVVEAKQFVLRDDDGHIRATLTADRDGTALVLFDSRESAQLELTQRDDGSSGVWVFSQGKHRATFGVGKDGNVAADLYDSSGIFRGGIGVDAEDVPSVILRDRDSKQRCTIFVADDGSPSVVLSDERDTDRLTLTLHSGGMAKAAWNDEDGRERVGIGVEKGPDAIASVGLFRKDSQPEIIFGSKPDQTAGFFVYSKTDGSRIGLSQLAEGGLWFGIADRDGKQLVRLDLFDGTAPRLELRDGQGNTVLSLPEGDADQQPPDGSE